MSLRYWRRDGIDFLRSETSTHRYARHAHEEYALGIVEAGAHGFAARGQRWTAVPGRLIVVNPDDAHDGGPAERGDVYSYRMIYVDAGVMAAALGEAGVGTGSPLFAEAVVDDADLSARFLDLHRSIEAGDARLERDTAMMTALAALARRHGGGAAVAGLRPGCHRGVARVVEYLAENFAEECALADLAALAGINRFNLLRAFQRSLGLPPHQYQTQLRLRHARRLMLAGEAPAMAAVAAGFTDQSHLIRKFKAAYGVTPGKYLGHVGRRRALQ